MLFPLPGLILISYTSKASPADFCRLQRPKKQGAFPADLSVKHPADSVHQLVKCFKRRQLRMVRLDLFGTAEEETGF